MTSAEPEQKYLSDIPFHPVFFVSLITSLANELEHNSNAPLFRGMSLQERLFFQRALLRALENADRYIGKTGDSL